MLQVMTDKTRWLDILFSLAGLIILFPLFLIVSVLIKLTSKGPAFFIQQRVGLNGEDFRMYKFRTMCIGAHEKIALTIGSNDERITGIGYFLRRHKIDELPQLLNVLKGDMSIVGPRPELRKFVNLYTPEQNKILSVRPGITDYASLKFINETELLAEADDPELYYQKFIIPEKINLNKIYINSKSLKTYFTILFKTVIGKTK